MTQPLVVFDNVVKHFGSYQAVERLNLEIYKGEFVAIMGSSGCGKTTTLRMLAGLDKPSEGEIRLNGERINDLYSWQRETPLVWQNLALFPFLNVLENVEFGLRMRGMAKAQRRKKALHWLERLDLGEFANRDISLLSGGQRQRDGAGPLTGHGTPDPAARRAIECPRCAPECAHAGGTHRAAKGLGHYLCLCHPQSVRGLRDGGSRGDHEPWPGGADWHAPGGIC
ncbi:ABC transporter ATP-binding protein [Pseudomonas sp. TH10]|uniref:ABC transporter ATP-binding protein n=1 Tax=Pseudomonas sp. TH10 TaxID=2796376 RepID=UPI001F5BE2A9|nr:ABC transporter ATP-binding protein [Pseudomonas sp. TH10]